MKTMNPGCNCCGRALIWGVVRGALWEGTETWLLEAGAEVDFAFGSDGSVMLPGSTFDPHTDGVDLGYWTGSIDNYKMIIWPEPSDNIPGGIPNWWDTVSIGPWSGRMVMTYAGVPGTTHSKATFLNSLGDRTGVQLNTDTQSRHGERLGQCTAEYINLAQDSDRFDVAGCTYIDFPWTATPLGLTEPGSDEDLLDGIIEMYNGPPIAMVIDHSNAGIANRSDFRSVSGNRVDFSVEDHAVNTGDASALELLFSVEEQVSAFGSEITIAEEVLGTHRCDSGDLGPGSFPKILRTYLPPATDDATIHSGGRRSIRKESGSLVEFVITHVTYPLSVLERTWFHPALLMYTDVCDSSTAFFDVIEDITPDPGPDPYRESHRRFVTNLWNKKLLPVT